MTPAMFHIGLHKTGTTSFQRALRLAQAKLSDGGVLYPAPPKNALFNGQHADVPLMLRKGKFSEVRAYFQQVSEEACSASDRQIRLILFSSEEFSNLCYDKKAMVSFKEIANDCFGEFTLIAVIRNLIDHCASGLRHRVDAAELLPKRLESDTVVLRQLLSVARKIRLLDSELGPIRIIDYEEAKTSGDLNNFLARKLLGADAPLLENSKVKRWSRSRRALGWSVALAATIIAGVAEAIATICSGHSAGVSGTDRSESPQRGCPTRESSRICGVL